MRREFALVLLVGAAGAGLVVLALRQPWAQAIFTAPRPLPAQVFSVTGQALIPLASALALAALACLAAVIATRAVARRASGALLAVLGAGAAAAATTGCAPRPCSPRPGPVPAAGALGGSTTSGNSPGNAHACNRHRGFIWPCGHGWRALARGGRPRRRHDHHGGPGHRVAGPALAGHVGQIRPRRPAAGQPVAETSRFGDDVGVAEPGHRPDARRRGGPPRTGRTSRAVP